ncbi:MAG: polyprenyl synthetase family protein [Phycisphaerales bacterium]|nr:polyprenyl synthetase family protein [Phycisphaerales bacterium]
MSESAQMRDSAAGLLAAVADCIGPELAAVDRLFHLELSSGIKCVDALVKHVSRFRGKMLRPMLVLLTGKACGKLTDAHITIATVVEMVHMATLVHDDVLDEAELRRKGATINHLRGNEAAVLLGDYLISHSYHLCSSLDSQRASRAIARTTNQVCEGELLQIDNRNNLDLDEKTYTQIITHKTAVLCAACCELGASLAGAPASTVSRMEKFGLCLGIAFQIQDDILDILGHTSQVGKTLGIDIEKGKMTLPMIHFMKNAPHEHQELLRSLLSGHEPDQVEKIRNLILPSDSIEYARQQARQYTQQARKALADLPASPARDVLDAMADFVICRTL